MKNYLKYLSLCFYVASLFTPIFIGSTENGLNALLYGGIFFVTGIVIYGIPWLGNLFYFVSLVLNKSVVQMKITLSLVTLICGLSAFFIRVIPIEKSMIEVKPGIGMILWQISFLIGLIYNIGILRGNKKIIL